MKKIYLFLTALVAMLTMSVTTANAQGYSFASAVMTPAPGEVEELSNIKMDYSAIGALAGDGFYSTYGNFEWITDEKGNKYVVTLNDYYNNSYVIIQLKQTITAPGTYTLTIPANALRPYSQQVWNEEYSWTWTIPGSDNPAPDPDPEPTGGPTVESYTASVNGIVFTFSEPVNVTNNGFDIAVGYCADVTENDGEPFAIKATGTGTNTITIEKQFGTFVNGYKYSVTFKPTHVKSVATGAELTGELNYTFVMGEGEDIGSVQVTNFTPQSGERQNGSLNNVSVTFSKVVNGVVNKEGISIKNENGHSLRLSEINLDSENPLGAVNINIDENEVEQEGTTYKGYIAAGAVRFQDGSTNDKELVFGGWSIKVTPITLVVEPAAYSIVEEVSTVKVSVDDPTAALEFVGKASDITITGIMEYQVNVYATCTSVEKQNDGSYVLSFDKVVKYGFEENVADIAGAQDGIKNQVRVNIPAGAFKQGIRTNNSTQTILYVQENVVIGELTWSFNPEAETTLTGLGVKSTSDNDGAVSTTYVIGISVKGENAYVRIPSAEGIKLLNEKGSTTINFGMYDLMADGVNQWVLDLGGSQKVSSPEYTLVIPKENIYVYNNPNFAGDAIHPTEDVEATWYINNETVGVSSLNAAVSGNSVIYNLQGQRTNANAKGVMIINGKKVVK